MRIRRDLPASLIILTLVSAPVLSGSVGAQEVPWLVTPPDLLPEGLHRVVLWSELQAMRTFFERTDVLELSEGIRDPRATERRDVTRLVASLAGGWQAAFAYVRDQAGFVPYSGSIRGAAGVLESGAGNALDQTLLLRAMLSAQGIESRLVRGRLAWSDAVELVLGPGQSPTATAEDPWPRWVEAASDHWWLEAEVEGSWLPLDAAFLGGQPGDVRGEQPDLLDEVPADQAARFRIEVLHSDRLLTGTEMHSGQLIGSDIEVFMESLAASEKRLADASSSPPVSGVNSGDAPRGQLFVPERPIPDPGPWMLHLVTAGAHLEAGPFEQPDLIGLAIRLTVEAPGAPTQGMTIPWGSRQEGGLTVAVEAGPVPTAHLERAAQPLYESLHDLAAVQLAAREAMRPPVAYADASINLHRVTRAAWMEFSRAAPAALAWAVLSSVDRVSGRILAGRVVRPGLRLAAVRWVPPQGEDSGAFLVYLDDPIVIGQLIAGADPAGLQAAYGLLQSSVVSHVMHRVAGHAPATAFDVTLRAIGTGQGLSWWNDPGTLPDRWPAAARSLASVDLDRGFVIMSSLEDDRIGPSSRIGWWSFGPLDGTTRGGVMTSYGFAQGEVSFADMGVGTMLDEVLASLPTLHRGLRWLANLTGTGPDGLDTVPFAACASAAIAAETMTASMPDDWARPDVALFCGGQ